METSGSVCFIRHPRTIGDLMIPHLLERERQYEIVKTIMLGKIDYENFITDMLADRQFIEDNAALCSRGEIWKCLLIRQSGQTGGVLVMPEGTCFVGWAGLADRIEFALDEADRAADSSNVRYSAEEVFDRLKKQK